MAFPRTQHSYLYVVTALARYYRRSPDQLKVEDLQVYFNYLVQERSLSPASCRVYLHGIRFLYLKVLHWAHFDVTLVLPLAPGLLQALRRYWQIRHPMLWLFPSDLLPDRHLHITTPQKVYHTAKTISGIEKCVGIHALRHTPAGAGFAHS